ncbi:MAG TPA: polymer-forming cytoskeletal protein [Candidatus Binatia bacterium]|nr:polymer-forming cytoskeletal protein [Candidatus Binatia bacterium]
MALFGKEDRAQRPEDTHPTVGQSPRSYVESTPSTSEAQPQTLLGKGSRVEGKLTFEGSVQVDGTVDGEIQAQETVIIGESAVVSAQVVANTIIIKGKVSGDVTARKRVELRAPAKLLGNIVTPSLVIQEGVVFEGHCTMGGAETKSDKSDKKVAIFPKEDRGTVAVRMSSEATN